MHVNMYVHAYVQPMFCRCVKRYVHMAKHACLKSLCMDAGMLHHSSAKGGLRRGGFSKGASSPFRSPLPEGGAGADVDGGGDDGGGGGDDGNGAKCVCGDGCGCVGAAAVVAAGAVQTVLVFILIIASLGVVSLVVVLALVIASRVSLAVVLGMRVVPLQLATAAGQNSESLNLGGQKEGGDAKTSDRGGCLLHVRGGAETEDIIDHQDNYGGDDFDDTAGRAFCNTDDQDEHD